MGVKLSPLDLTLSPRAGPSPATRKKPVGTASEVVVVATAVVVSTNEAAVVRAVVVSIGAVASEVVPVEVGSGKDSVVETLTSV